MSELTSLHSNPYLPSFVNQRPRLGEAPMPAMTQPVGARTYSQIHNVNDFDGADAYASGLANGASEIIADGRPNLARVYVVAKDANGQALVQGFNLVPVDRPKPVTMGDLNEKMSLLLERMNKLEEEQKNAKSGNGNAFKAPKQPAYTGNQPGGRNSSGSPEPAGGNGSAGYAEQSAN